MLGQRERHLITHTGYNDLAGFRIRDRHTDFSLLREAHHANGGLFVRPGLHIKRYHGIIGQHLPDIALISTPDGELPRMNSA